MLLLILGSGFVLSSFVALAVLVIDRLHHPPTNGHYRGLEKDLGGK